jgi:hypothetical protein
MNSTLDSRIHLMNDWFQRINRRPLLGFYLDSQYPLHRYPGSRKNLPNGVIGPENIVVEDYLADCDRLFDLYERAGGDLLWSAAPFFGLPWVEASLGCKVIANHATGSTRSEPPDDFAACLANLTFSADNPWVIKLSEFIEKLKKHSQGRYPVGVTLMRGISDLLSAIYGGERFLFKTLDSPDEVLDLADRLADYWIAFGQFMLDQLDLFHGGTSSFFYGVWCPGRTIWMQEDAAALLSPNLYEQFIHPAVLKIIGHFEHTVMHLHPSRFMPVDYLVGTPLSAVEIHIDRGGPRAAELADYYFKVLGKKPLIIWGDIQDADLDFILNHLPWAGLAIIRVVASPEEAQKIWDAAIGSKFR